MNKKMDETKTMALRELMGLMRESMSGAYYEGYTAGYEHRTKVEASEMLKKILDMEAI